MSPCSRAITAKPTQPGFMNFMIDAESARRITHKILFSLFTFIYIPLPDPISLILPLFPVSLSLMMTTMTRTGHTRLTEIQVSSPSLTYLFLASVSPHHALWHTMCLWLIGRRDSTGSKGRWWRGLGAHCFLSLSWISLYLWYLPHDQGHAATPGTTFSHNVLVIVSCKSRLSSCVLTFWLITKQ